MSDILASVSVVLGGEISGFKAAMADARKELKGLVQFSEGLKDIGGSLTTYVSAPLLLLGAGAVAASAKLDSLQRGLNAITTAELAKNGVSGLDAVRDAAQATGERMQQLQQIAKAPGIGFEQAVQGDIRLRAVGISADQSAKALKEFANAIATTGGGASEFDRVTTQLAQLSAKGKVLSQDLRPIIEAAPAVSQALLKLYGTIDSESISASLAKQGKSSQDFIATLTDELGKLPRVTGGLANSFENLQQTTVQSMAKVGDAISKALNIPALTEGLSNGIERLGDGFAALSPGTQSLIVGLGAVAAAVGPVLVAVGTLGAALPAITAGFEVLGVSSVAALGPILPVAAAVAAAAYLIYENWDAITSYFTTGEGATLFSNLADAATSATDSIGEAFSTLRANTGGNLGEMASASSVFKGAFQEVAVGITAILNTVSGAITAITSLFTGDFSRAADGAAQAFDGLLAPLRNLLGLTPQVQATNPILVLSKSATEFNAVMPEFAANLALLNSVRLGPLAEQAGEAAKQIGLLASLEAQLKDAKDAKPNLTNEADIAASNQLIASLEAQIKRLNELGIASKEMQKAYADVQKSLRTVAQESLALGDQYDYLKNRQSATESGIKKLISAGFSPASSAVRTLVADLKNLNNTLGDNTQLAGRVPEGLDKAFKTPDFKLEVPKIQGLDELPVLPDYGAIFKKAATDVAENGGALPDAVGQIKGRFTQAMADFNTGSEEALAELKDNLISGLSGIGEAIGSSLFDGASVGDALKTAFAPIVAALADFAAKKGKLYIAMGIADLAIPGFQAQGLAEIAGGTALLIAAGIAGAGASALASSGRSGSSGAGTVNTSASSSPRAFTPTTAPAATAATPAVYKHQVVITANGRDLQAVLALETDRFGRVVGHG